MKDIRRLCYEAILSVDGAEHIDYDKVHDDTEIYGSGFDLDSLGLAELTTILEKKFHITISDEEIMEAEAFENFGVLCRFMSEKIGK